MSAEKSSVQLEKGIVSTDPSDFAQAVELVRRDKHRVLWIRHDYLDKSPDPPVVDFSLLAQVPFLEDLGLSPNLAFKRITNFEAIYELSQLKKLSAYDYKQLDLSKFPKLETLFVMDSRGLKNWESLAELRHTWITKLRTGDLSFLAGLRQLSQLRLTQAASKSMSGLDSIQALAKLEISHCSKLEAIEALPASLVDLKIKKCPRLVDLSFLAKHASLETLYVDVMQDVGFVPGLRHLSYIGFENVLDGDLNPLVKSASLRNVGFYPTKRKHYTHSEAELKEILGARS